MRNNFSFVVIFGIFSGLAVADAAEFRLNSAPLELTTQAMSQWRRDFAAPIFDFMDDPKSDFVRAIRKTGNLSHSRRTALMDFLECRPVEGINAVVCMSFNNSTMNDTFVRMSVFKDGGPDILSGSIMAPDSQFFHSALEFAAGHNTNITTVRNFFKKAKAEGIALSRNEARFGDHILPQLEAMSQADLQILAIDFKAKTLSYFSHELDHALFGAIPVYQKVVADFWQQVVSRADRKAMRELLFKMGYDKRNKKVMMDEFQAYLLQVEADSHYLRDYVPTYRKKLLQALAQKNLSPAFVSCEEELTL